MGCVELFKETHASNTGEFISQAAMDVHVSFMKTYYCHKLTEESGRLMDCIDLFRETHASRTDKFVLRSVANVHVSL